LRQDDTKQPGQRMRFTVDDIKRETVRAFMPLRCEVQDFDYDSGFDFWIYAEDPALVYMGKLRTSQYQDPKALAEVFRRWRAAVAAKGHELSPWTAPSSGVSPSAMLFGSLALVGLCLWARKRGKKR
jgi:hypothetical protein